MIYTSLKIGEKVYNFRLTTKMLKELKFQTGKAPLSIMKELKDLDPTPLFPILLYSLKWENPNLTIDDVDSMYDEFIDMGYSINELSALVTEIMRISGLLPSIDIRMADVLKTMGIDVPSNKVIDIKKIDKKK